MGAGVFLFVVGGVFAFAVGFYTDYQAYKTQDARIERRVEAWSDMMKRQCVYEGGTPLVWVDTGRFKACRNKP